MYTDITLIDLQKLFATIGQKIFFDKPLPKAFSKNAISWYKSYLAKNLFTIEFSNRVSKFAKISCGVPQGSILGTLLFFIYVSDMNHAVDINFYLYANDSCLLFQHK